MLFLEITGVCRERQEQRSGSSTQFLKAANELRFRPVRVLAEQPKVVRLADLPNHPAVQIFRPLPRRSGSGSPGYPAARETPDAHTQSRASCIDCRLAVAELG
jgi:hypothetical protein